MALSRFEFQLGLVEGFYGRIWSSDDRLLTVERIAEAGYKQYVYAPKGDAALRRNWSAKWDQDSGDILRRFGRQIEACGMQWGAGLSPIGLVADLSRPLMQKLRDKVRYLEDFGVQTLCILFDDMRADLPDLAARQAEIVDQAVAASSAVNALLVCPSYYSTDPVLEDVFGTMPPNYWAELGASLPQEAAVFWTGDRVCATHFDRDQVTAARTAFGRDLVLWDNYPVNDGAKSSRFLHLEAFSGREAWLSELVAGHFANPMNQCRLSDVPLLSLPAVYRLGDQYQAQAATHSIAHALYDAGTADWMLGLIPELRPGLDQISSARKRSLIKECASIDHPIACELADWLNEAYRFDPACLTD